MTRRWLFFLLSILVGLVVGGIYGWIINPVEYVDTTPDTLRADYKADYVLMVAEIYQVEGDPALAARRLAVLGDAPPLTLIEQALRYGAEIGYSDMDLVKLSRLAKAVAFWTPEATAP
ncbi:MAG: hypothetical protein AB1345_10025 [Chloroflexota bacterium]